jgi:hypothetical protein
LNLNDILLRHEQQIEGEKEILSVFFIQSDPADPAFSLIFDKKVQINL